MERTTVSEEALRILQFDRVRERLAAQAQSEPGRALCRALEPLTGFEAVAALHAETRAASALLAKGRRPPLDGIFDVRRLLDRAGRGAVLHPEEILQVRSTLGASRRLRGFLEEEGGPPEALAARAAGLVRRPELEAQIDRCIDEHGEVLDRASDELRRIRQHQREIQARVRQHLERLVHDSRLQDVLQESLVTVRNGRYVVPVRQERRSELPGVVHDQSASGSTVFVEPMAVVELNNRLRQAEAAEAEEIRRILAALSQRIGQEAPGIGPAVEALAGLDLVFARARLGFELNAVEPVLNDEGRVRLIRARHPLLPGPVVPIDVWLGEGFHVLVITGPNTGGKTVALKTVGLLALMAQAGLPVPAAQAELPVFQAIYADIGDEQSIEQSLSTFSSHMRRVVPVLEAARAESLVLLDEIGAGTDPDEGAALAEAILEHLRARGARVVATTHYSQLKGYAYLTEGVENASVEFDPESLRPTYRLQIGLPGRSNALEIAARLGAPPEVIENARRKRPSHARRADELIIEMESSRRAAREHESRTAAERREAEVLRERYEALVRELEERRSGLVEDARRQAEAVLREARREADRLLGELRRLQDQAKAEEARRRRDELVEALAFVEAQAEARRPGPGAPGEAGGAPAPEAAPGPAPGEPASLRPGVRVRVAGLGQEGVLLTAPGAGGEAEVQVGALRVRVGVERLRALPGAPPQGPGGKGSIPGRERRTPEPGGAGSLGRSKAQTLPSELDLRGLRADEAWSRVEKYLDDCLLAGLSRVRLIHGKGTGALREEMRRRLDGVPQVRRHVLAPPEEGGDGVTVVDLG
ncbi:endonuclease MutS2 [Limnochorda pilosa]|uniref:Endonuclease MutS2 n=1 Tax=Limnochorda pilosa TaxID=1555112 RepID=A0A0K2SMH1_LIMPI|nr:endonuclease MutS2 [Limnochorda pilosa]BAS28328.1 DNA mismatch repair protein MutS [Limnochorda pilosa]